MTRMDFISKELLDTVHRRGRDLGYSDAVIKRASEMVLDDEKRVRQGTGCVVQPGRLAVPIWAETLLDMAVKELR